MHVSVCVRMRAHVCMCVYACHVCVLHGLCCVYMFDVVCVSMHVLIAVCVCMDACPCMYACVGSVRVRMGRPRH